MFSYHSMRASLQVEQLGARLCLSSSPMMTVELQPDAALNHGVTVLAWARVDGVSPLQTQSQQGTNYFDGKFLSARDLTREQSASHTFDDVIVDGRIITVENYDSAMLEDAIASSSYIGVKNLNCGGQS